MGSSGYCCARVRGITRNTQALCFNARRESAAGVIYKPRSIKLFLIYYL